MREEAELDGAEEGLGAPEGTAELEDLVRCDAGHLCHACSPSVVGGPYDTGMFHDHCAVYFSRRGRDGEVSGQLVAHRKEAARQTGQADPSFHPTCATPPATASHRSSNNVQEGRV